MKRVNVSMPDDVFDRLESARAREPRSAFVARMLDEMLPKSVGPKPPSDPPKTSPRLVPASGVGRERDGAMGTPSSVPALSGSNPEPPPETVVQPDPVEQPPVEFELPKIAPRSWGR